MRVCLVLPHYAPFRGGVEIHAERIAAGLVAHGHEVEVFAQAPETETAICGDVLVHRFRPLVPARHLEFAPSLWHALRRQAGRFHIVHAHSYHALPALGAALAGGPPLVFTPHFHGHGHSRFRDALHLLYRPAGLYLFGRAAAVICVSEPEAALVRDRYPGSADEITVIPNGIDAAAIAAAAPFEHRGPVLLSVGRLEAYKQVERALDALEFLPAKWRLVIIGSGPQAGRLREQIAVRGLAGRAQLAGAVSDEELHRWYRTAAAYLSMSKDEAFGITPLEAVAGGAAVVASDIEAHRYGRALAAANGSFELVDCAADGRQLAGAIERAVGSARPSSLMIPTWDTAAEQTLALYERVLGRAA